MTMQSIIDRAESIEISRGRIIAQTISRSQRLKTSERSAAIPWMWRVTPAAHYYWSENRDLIETLDYNDRSVEYTLKLSNNSGMAYITQYRGVLSPSQVNNLSISTSTTATLTITGLPAIAGGITSSTVVFRAGDFVQPANSRYPYTVLGTVTRGSGSTIDVSVNRDIITSEGISLAGQDLLVGTEVSWRMVVTNKPSYRILPYNRLQFTGDFELMEKII